MDEAAAYCYHRVDLVLTDTYRAGAYRAGCVYILPS